MMIDTPPLPTTTSETEVIIVEEGEEEPTYSTNTSLIPSPQLSLLEEHLDSETYMIFHGGYVPEQQAEMVENRANQVAFAARYHLLELGYILYHAEVLRLYSYLGYDDMKTWATSMGISAEMRTHALDLYKIWPEMEKYGYGVRDLVDGKITPVKARLIANQTRDWNRQVKQIKDAHKNRNPQEFETAMEETFALIHAEIEEIREKTDQDLLVEKSRRDGRTQNVEVMITGGMINPRNDRFDGTITFTCTPENLEQIAHGHCDFIFYLRGRDGSFSLKELVRLLVDPQIGEIDAEGDEDEEEEEDI